MSIDSFRNFSFKVTASFWWEDFISLRIMLYIVFLNCGKSSVSIDDKPERFAPSPSMAQSRLQESFSRKNFFWIVGPFTFLYPLKVDDLKSASAIASNLAPISPCS